MSILPIYTYGHPVLRKKAKPVKTAGHGLAEFVEDMFTTMQNAGGIGLAATQVGSLQRVIVVDVSEMGEEGQGHPPVAMLNPVVVSSQGTRIVEEGCLSIPDIRGEVERVDAITVRYHDLALQEHELTADGILARVILHEIDHLNGVLFIDYLGTVTQKLLTGRLNKIRRGEMEIGYPFISEQAPVSSTA